MTMNSVDDNTQLDSPSPLPRFNAMVSSAKIIPPKRKFNPQYDSWQEQLWDYYDRLGEFESAVTWRSNTMSRVRLVAAELSPGGDEPVPVREGPAAEAVERLAGGTGGQAQLMKEATIHLSVPGEGWLTGETSPDTQHEEWTFRSADELTVGRFRGNEVYYVQEGDDRSARRPLVSDSVVVRVWDPHPRFGWKSDSAAKHAMGAMLELDLINKRIVATILSRLASNGILLYDKQKLSFGSSGQPAGADEFDQFAKILVDVASKAIADPTSPEAAIPIPVGFDMESLEDVDPKALLQWITSANPIDSKLLEQRTEAVKSLATSLDLPADILLGLSGMNHWGAWQIEESGIKVHISPIAELICHSLTVGYLVPTLKAMGADLRGPNGGRLVMWYDPSEITQRPDRSANVIEAYKMGEVPGRVLRREIGLNEEGDAPTKDDLRDWATKFAMRQPNTAFTIIDDLGGPAIVVDDKLVEIGTGEPLAASQIDESADASGQDDEDAPTDEGERAGTPDTREAPPPAQVIGVDGLTREQLEQLRNEVDAALIDKGGSTWYEATVPVEQRVTPQRRNGGRVDSTT